MLIELNISNTFSVYRILFRNNIVNIIECFFNLYKITMVYNIGMGWN